MPATIISGKDVSCQIREELKGRRPVSRKKGTCPDWPSSSWARTPPRCPM